MRNLAQRSAAAAKEIKVLIDDSVEKVGSGTKLVEQAGATMHEVVTSIRQVTDIVAEISAATAEQNAGIAQVHQAITDMDQVTQQNAALVEQTAAASQAMQDQAAHQAHVVSAFKIDPASAARHAATVTTLRSPAVVRPAVRPAARAAAPRAQQAKQVASAGGNSEWEQF